MFKVFEVRVLKVPRVEKKLVVVALVPVELVKRIFEKFIFVPLMFVKTEFVENKLLVVAFVPVALMKVKFCKVEEAVAKMLAKVPKFTEALEEKRLVLDAVGAWTVPAKYALPSESMVVFLELRVKVSLGLPKTILPEAEKSPLTPREINDPPLAMIELLVPIPPRILRFLPISTLPRRRMSSVVVLPFLTISASVYLSGGMLAKDLYSMVIALGSEIGVA